jgi:hypothetical protein
MDSGFRRNDVESCAKSECVLQVPERIAESDKHPDFTL